MNLITGYFTYTRLVNVIQQTVKGKVCRIFILSLVMLLYVATWASSMPVWAVPPVRKRAIPLPLPCPLPSPCKIPPQNQCKTQTVACSESECLPVHKSNCLEISLELAEHHPSTAYSSSSREPLPGGKDSVCISPLAVTVQLPLSTWRSKKGWDGTCLRNERLLQQGWLDSHPGNTGLCLGHAGHGRWNNLSWGVLGSSQGYFLYNVVPTSPLLFSLWLSKLCVDASKDLVFKQIFFCFAQSAVQCVCIFLHQTGGKVTKWFL